MGGAAGVNQVSLSQATNIDYLGRRGNAMPSTLEALQAEVLRLSPADRARLLDRLIASLDVDTDAEGAWDGVADKREQELAAGSAQAVQVELVVARLEARFPG